MSTLRQQPFTVKISSSVTLACTRWHFAPTQQPPAPPQQAPRFSPNVLICVHQWGKLGGSGMLLRGIATNTVKTIATTLNSPDLFDAVTFHLRGVERSTGSPTWRCIDEIDDVLGVAKFAVDSGASNVYLIGSSAGACVAGSALATAPSPLQDRIKAACFIAYPHGTMAGIMFSTHFDNLKKSAKPKMFVHGDDDGFSSVSQIRDFAKAVGNAEVTVIPGGHFEVEQPQWDSFMSKKCAEFILRVLETELREKKKREEELSAAAAASSSEQSL